MNQMAKDAFGIVICLVLVVSNLMAAAWILDKAICRYIDRVNARSSK